MPQLVEGDIQSSRLKYHQSLLYQLRSLFFSGPFSVLVSRAALMLAMKILRQRKSDLFSPEPDRIRSGCQTRPTLRTLNGQPLAMNRIFGSQRAKAPRPTLNDAISNVLPPLLPQLTYPRPTPASPPSTTKSKNLTGNSPHTATACPKCVTVRAKTH